MRSAPCLTRCNTSDAAILRSKLIESYVGFRSRRHKGPRAHRECRGLRFRPWLSRASGVRDGKFRGAYLENWARHLVARSSDRWCRTQRRCEKDSPRFPGAPTTDMSCSYLLPFAWLRLLAAALPAHRAMLQEFATLS